MASLLESSRKSSVYVVSAQIICRILGMAATVILARNLTVADYGVYNLFFGSILIFSFLTNFGLAGSLQRFLAEYAGIRKYGLFFRTFFFSMTFRLLSGVIVFTAAILVYDRLAGYLGVSAYKYEFTLFCLGTYALFQADFLQLALNSLFLHRDSCLGQMAYVSLRLGSFVVLLVFLEGGLSAVYGAELLAYGAGAVLLWILFQRNAYFPQKKCAFQKSQAIEWKRFFRFSAYNAATIPGGILFNQAMDFFVVAAMATTNQLGIYALGSRASNMLLSIMPQNLLQTVLRPAFYHHYYSVEEKRIELNRMFRSLVVLIAAVLFPALVLVAIQAEFILTLIFKSKFVEATPIFIILLAFSVFRVLELPSDLVLQAIEKVQARLYAQVFAVYNIVAAVLLMPRLGLLGVAFSTGSALMGKCLFWYFMAHRYAGISLCWSALLRIGANTMVAAVVAYGVGKFGDSPLWMLASMVMGFIVYIGMSLVNHFFDDREKELVNKFCRRRIFRVPYPAEVS
jgi:O-antigen/teichoic acid export membrane protein